MYVELHCHSAFSFLDGASLPEQLVLAAQSLGYPALALTDHDGLYGSMEFAQAAKAFGMKRQSPGYRGAAWLTLGCAVPPLFASCLLFLRSDVTGE